MLNQNMTNILLYMQVKQYTLVEKDRICIGFHHFWIATLKRNVPLTFDLIPILQERKKSFQVWMMRVIFTWLLSAKKLQTHLILRGVNHMRRLKILINIRLKQKEISKSCKFVSKYQKPVLLKFSITWENPLIISFIIDYFSSKLYFKNPDKSDLGTYSISVSDTDGVSSSFVMDDEGKVLTISNDSSFYHLDWTENCPRKNCRNNQTIHSLLCIKKKQKTTQLTSCD